MNSEQKLCCLHFFKKIQSWNQITNTYIENFQSTSFGMEKKRNEKKEQKGKQYEELFMQHHQKVKDSTFNYY